VISFLALVFALAWIYEHQRAENAIRQLEACASERQALAGVHETLVATSAESQDQNSGSNVVAQDGSHPISNASGEVNLGNTRTAEVTLTNTLSPRLPARLSCRLTRSMNRFNLRTL
jgi:hypothetical protein